MCPVHVAFESNPIKLGAVTTTEANLASSLISKLPVSQLTHQDANIKYIIICLNAVILTPERLINNYTLRLISKYISF